MRKSDLIAGLALLALLPTFLLSAATDNQAWHLVNWGVLIVLAGMGAYLTAQERQRAYAERMKKQISDAQTDARDG